MKTKFKLIALALTVSLSFSYAQIPVTDGAHIAQALKQIEEMQNQYKQLLKQYDAIKEQIKQAQELANDAKNHLESLTKFDGLDLQDYIKKLGIDKGLLEEKLKSISSEYDSMLGSFLENYKNDFDTKAGITNVEGYKVSRDNKEKYSGYAFAQNELSMHGKNIDSLSKASADADDPKKRELINNELNAEIARMNLKKEVLELEQKKQDEVMEAKKKEEISKFNDRANEIPDFFEKGFKVDIDLGNKKE